MCRATFGDFDKILLQMEFVQLHFQLWPKRSQLKRIQISSIHEAKVAQLDDMMTSDFMISCTSFCLLLTQNWLYTFSWKISKTGKLVLLLWSTVDPCCWWRSRPLVVKYIGELKEERIRKHEVTYEGHIAELARLREAALKKGSFSSAVNAEANRGKAAGLYIDRKIIKTGKLEDMSEQELEAKMKQILDDYGQLINVTPPSITSESSSPSDEESSSDPQK